MELQAKDLRIRNLIHDNRGNIIDIESIGMDGVNLRGSYVDCTDAYYKWNELKPIPLTEEFKEKLKDTPMFMDKQGFVIFKNGYSYAFVWEDYPFLHELQNLYFALTKEELQIK